MRPLRTPGLPGAPIEAQTRVEPEDFLVEEVPLSAPSGKGPHLWLQVRKRALSTFEVLERLARAVETEPRHCGHAGLKDKHAITTQWLSVPSPRGPRPDWAQFEFERDGFEVLASEPHHSRLKMGQLRGNRFRIRLRDADLAASGALEQNLSFFERHGVPNWFGEQRFGSGGRNLEKGLRILHDPQARGIRRMRKQLVKLLLSSVQSEVFHHVLTERLEDTSALEHGDIAWLHHNGACFLVEDPREEQIRAERFEISPTGPLPGPKMLRAKSEPGELEQAVFDALGLQPEDFGKLPFQAAPGARRPLRVRLSETRVEVREPAESEPGQLWIEFTLERGAFATTVLRDLLADSPWFDDEPNDSMDRA